VEGLGKHRCKIPEDKRYFRIGEVSRIVGVKPYVLRFWESEFPQIRPKRADSKHRTYERKDVELILEIKRLLYEERLTIEGAKKRLRERQRKEDLKEFIRYMRYELQDLLKLLK